MFCYQCQQTAGGTGCRENGLCGKDPQTAALQDLLTGWVKQIAQKRMAYRQMAVPGQKKRSDTGRASRAVDRFLLEALYATMTNVNFDAKEIARLIFKASQAFALAEFLTAEIGEENADEFKMKVAELEKQLQEAIPFPSDEQIAELVAQGEAFELSVRLGEYGPEISGLQELVLYGVRGVAAYIWHFFNGGHAARESLRLETEGIKLRIKEFRGRTKEDRAKKTQLQKDVANNEKTIDEWEEKETSLLDGLFAELAAIDERVDRDPLLASALKVGELNLSAMELLEKFHWSWFGNPFPSVVQTGAVPGKCILVSGHDLSDLYEILVQTQGKEINVYTHGEMLPAHAYPRLKRFPHLVGHFGTSWQNQREEFDSFPGAILMTSNCIQKPEESYADYIFTTGPVAWPGVAHIDEGKDGKKDFYPVIRAALDSSGFFHHETGEKLTVGYGAEAVTQIEKDVENAMKQGTLKRFFVIAGCDGPQENRRYFTELAEAVPQDCVILTCGCGKFRFNSIKFPPLASGIPHLWDAGQCNDTWSIISILQILSKAQGCELDSFPVSVFLSWFEQKAVAILLSLLSLNIRSIHIGPTAPAFLSPEVLALLSENYGLKVVSNSPQADVDAIMNSDH